MTKGPIRGSANGRPPAFEAGHAGSNPAPRIWWSLFIVLSSLSVVCCGSVGGGVGQKRKTKNQEPKNMEVIRPDEDPVSKTGDEATRLWVRVPRLPLILGPSSNRKTPVLQTGNLGATPSGIHLTA